MLLFYFAIISLGIYDMFYMIKRKLKKEIAVYIIFTMVIIAISLYYYSDSLNRSFSDLMLGLFQLKE